MNETTGIALVLGIYALAWVLGFLTGYTVRRSQEIKNVEQKVSVQDLRPR
jgi:hypothetical protein